MNETVKNPLGTDPTGRLLLRFALPCVVSFVVNSLYNMVDQIFIGQSVGYLGNAATNIILPLNTVLLALGFMVGDGAAANLSLCLGRKQPEEAARGVACAITLTLAEGIALAVLFELFMQPLCRLFGATDDVLPYAMAYGRIIVAGFPMSIICCSFGSSIRADGRPTNSMIGLLLGCGTNMILDPVFIFVFHWGVQGAAFATIIGQTLNAVYFATRFFTFRHIRLKRAYFRPTLRMTGRLMSLGLSSFITQIAGVFVIATMNNVLVSYGAVSKYGADIPLAALGVTMKVNQLMTSIALGIAVGAQPIYGYNYGARNLGRVKQTYKRAAIAATVVMTAAFLVFEFAPELIIRIFGNESDLYNEFAVKCFRRFMAATPVVGFGIVTGTFFQSLGKPVHATFLSLSRQVLFLIPAILIMARLLGVDGVLWAGPVSDVLATSAAAILLTVSWKSLLSEKA